MIRWGQSVSRKTNTLSTIETTGLRKLIAVASATGILDTAAKTKVAEVQASAVRTMCRGQLVPMKLGLTFGRINRNRHSAMKAKTNRPALCCMEWMPVSVSDGSPKILAINDVAAKSALAATIKAMATGACRDAECITIEDRVIQFFAREQGVI